ncbi:MAG: efflux transporter outer membrane subunit [Candidatus Gastranaerophilaceae bacterium]|jgi:NodT family efflux transporter outer membrane factor (OMF) lipoprotein
MLKQTIKIFLFILILGHFSLSCLAKQDYSEQKSIESYINKLWWQKFNDPVLLEYILKAANNNKDIKISTLKIAEARAKVSETFGKELPQVTTLGSYTRIKPPGAKAGQNQGYKNLFTIPVLASYEVDLWQKNRNATQQDEQRLEITKQNDRTNYITVTTETASAYFNILKLDKLICLQKELLCLTNQDQVIKKSTYDAGLIPCNDVVLSAKNSKEASIQLKNYEKQLEIFINELYVLTGESPEGTRCLTRKSIDELCLLTDIPCEIPSTKILNRPDILTAEDNLKIAKIDVSLARKDFLPNIYVYGLATYDSAKVFNLNRVWGATGATAIQKIFTGGQRRATLKGKKFSYEEMLRNYEKTILTSLQEVNNSMVYLKNDVTANNDYLDKLAFEVTNLNLLDKNYQTGLISYLDTIQSRMTVIQLQQQQIQSKTDCLIDSLNLYKALAGQL